MRNESKVSVTDDEEKDAVIVMLIPGHATSVSLIFLCRRLLLPSRL